jgi:ribosomal protein L37AE/L43A
VRPEDIREVEVRVKKYVWICPVCGKTISSFTRAMTLKYARLHARKHEESTR